jgi:hypothetical protein
MSAVQWLSFIPKLGENVQAWETLRQFAAAFGVLAKAGADQERNVAAERLRRGGLQAAVSCKGGEHQYLVAALHVLADLVKQGWRVRVAKGSVEVARPVDAVNDGEGLRERVRRQLHAQRDEQLRQRSVREFIHSMETRRLFGDQFVSIFSLMRDGPELAHRLRDLQDLGSAEARLEAGPTVIRPYLQFFTEEDRCSWTGLRLIDVWRYFRHTWANPHKSVPGRTMMVLVRDAAAPFHPVLGIAALSSAAVAMTVRDEMIGWTSRQVVQRIRKDPTDALAAWLQNTVDEAINEIYIVDLLRRELVSLHALQQPTSDAVKALDAEAKRQRKQHYRLMDAKTYKRGPKPEKMTPDDWVQQAEWMLFVSKRCQELAHLLKVRMALRKHFGEKPSKEGLTRLVETGEGREAVARVVRKAKADHVGTAIADLTVCGALPPYNEVLGGKLVAMLMTSPEVAVEYKRRYGGVPSVIASSMAGRRVIRPADLVYLGTTSLYAQRPTQYDRISITLDPGTPSDGAAVRYEYLGRTLGVGTFQFGEKTVEALGRLLANSRRGQRVNSVFGEGVNPRLRKIRDGLDTLGLSSDELLQHGAPRLVYGVALAANVGEYLLGLENRPRYYFPMEAPAAVTQQIGAWWARRWLLPRVARPETLKRVAGHHLVYPMTHRARVPLPEADINQRLLFGD